MSNNYPVKKLPSVEFLRACFAYNPKTGALTWKHRPREHFATKKAHLRHNSTCAGTIAGSIYRNGRRYIHLGHRLYFAHRIIWKIVTGEEPLSTIDHKNRNRDDNRWTNLRSASLSEQNWNSSTRKDNTSSRRGVSLDRDKWVARIMIHRTSHYLGSFTTALEASAAYQAAAKKWHGEFYRT